MPLVVAKGLTRLFGKNGIEGVDLEVSAGEVVGLIGPNGGGKSTLLMLLAGLLEPSHGHVHIEGVRSTVLARNGAGKVGLITSQYGLYPFLSGRENLDFFGGLFGLKPSDVTERVGSWLEKPRLATGL